jgi:hypothetical protein
VVGPGNTVEGRRARWRFNTWCFTAFAALGLPMMLGVWSVAHTEPEHDNDHDKAMFASFARRLTAGWAMVAAVALLCAWRWWAAASAARSGPTDG